MNIEEFKEMCLSFPHATEDVKWGKDLCFLVGGKMFAAAGLVPAGLHLYLPPRLADLPAALELARPATRMPP